MRNIILLSCTFILLGCKEYDKSEIKGGWNTLIDDQYCELWFNDDLVLDWNYEFGTLRLRNYEVRNNIIYFSEQYLDNEPPNNIAFSMKIKSIRNGSMVLENVVHPEHPNYTYNSIHSEPPPFSLDILNSEKQRELELELIQKSEKRIKSLN